MINVIAQHGRTRSHEFAIGSAARYVDVVVATDLSNTSLVYRDPLSCTSLDESAALETSSDMMVFGCCSGGGRGREKKKKENRRRKYGPTDVTRERVEKFEIRAKNLREYTTPRKKNKNSRRSTAASTGRSVRKRLADDSRSPPTPSLYTRRIRHTYANVHANAFFLRVFIIVYFYFFLLLFAFSTRLAPRHCDDVHTARRNNSSSMSVCVCVCRIQNDFSFTLHRFSPKLYKIEKIFQTKISFLNTMMI